MKHVSDGNRIRTYVLVALPIAGRANKDVKRNAREAFRELDDMAREQKGQDQVEVTTVAPQRGQEVSVVRPDGTSSTLNLMPVDNAEYRARREEALKKPGAVIGQVTVAN